MRGVKKNKQSRGYTIVEVMIVLAVSGLLFVIAGNFINGKQQRTAFTQGSNELGSQLQKVIDEVVDGHYSDIPLSCSASGAGTVSVQTAAKTQGTNPQCVFIGKLAHFYKSAGTEENKYEVLSLASARTAKESDPSPYSSVASIESLKSEHLIPQNLEVTRMEVTGAGGGNFSSVYSIGFVQSLGTADTDSTLAGAFKTGAQTIRLIYTNTTNKDNAIGAGVNPSIQTAASAWLCVSDGTRFAKVSIGGTTDENGGNQLNVRVQQKGTVSCTT